MVTFQRGVSGSSSAVERQLPKLDVAGSIPVSRSIVSNSMEKPAGVRVCAIVCGMFSLAVEMGQEFSAQDQLWAEGYSKAGRNLVAGW